MSKGKYILVNGSFVPTDEYRISLPEADGFLFSEKIRAIRSSFPFFRETLELIRLKLQIFNHSFPEFTNNDGSELRRQLERTLTKNKQFLGAVLVLTFRFPDQKIQYSIQSESIESIGFDLNEKGLYVDIFDQIRKPASSISNLSLGSEMYWNIARNDLRNSSADRLLILNSDEQIIEVSESNIYVIKGKMIRGASKEQGAFMDVTRPFMLDIFKKLRFEYTEGEGVTRNDFKESEEVFIVNSIEGVRWIVGFEGKRFFNNSIRKISELFSLRD